MIIYLVNNFAIKSNHSNKFDLYKKHYDFNVNEFVWCYCITVDGFNKAEEIAIQNKDYPLMFKGVENLQNA